jgi:purine nucleoside phosphorylase
MVRLQIAMLCELGVKQFVLTCAAGSIDPYISVGDLAIMNSFVMFGNEIMPLWGGDFVSPEDVLEPSWIPIAGDAAIMADISPIHMGVAHAYVRGPHFEGRHLDKGNLAKLGAQTVGMSVKPECCVAAIYGARALGIAFITNDAVETHDHETNVARTKAVSDKLGGFLSRVVTTLP